ncbi:MAG TPA: hypothetical protein VGC96_04295 [Candidatus Elarobacter sp.]
MPDLYVSLLGAPFRAVIAHAGGERAFVRIADRADDDFGLDPAVWIDHVGAACGTQAALLDRGGHAGVYRRVRCGSPETADDAPEWSPRDVLAILVRRLITAAETQAGEPMQRIVAVVPATLTAAERAECTQALLLAGAQRVDLLTADAALGGAPAEAGATRIIVEAWDDVTRVTVAAADAEPRVADVTAALSRETVREMFRRAIGLRTEFDAARTAIADQLFGAWIAARDAGRAMTASVPVAHGAPVTATVPAAALAGVDDALRERLRELFAANGADPARAFAIDVLGSWTRPVARALRALAAAPNVVRDDRGLELDGAIRVLPPQARSARAALTSDVFAVAESARALRALAQGEPIQLLAAGARLPATAISENFASSSFIGSFRIAARANRSETPLMMLTIPRYAERQGSSYLRAVVHADTPDYLLLEVAYLYSTRRRFSFFDKSTQAEIPLSDHVFRVVRT